MEDYCLILYVFNKEREYHISIPKHLNNNEKILLDEHRIKIVNEINTYQKILFKKKLKIIADYCYKINLILITGWCESKKHKHEVLTIEQLYAKIKK